MAFIFKTLSPFAVPSLIWVEFFVGFFCRAVHILSYPTRDWVLTSEPPVNFLWSGFFLAALWGTWDLSSPSRDGTHTSLQWKLGVLTTKTTRRSSLIHFLKLATFWSAWDDWAEVSPTKALGCLDFCKPHLFYSTHRILTKSTMLVGIASASLLNYTCWRELYFPRSEVIFLGVACKELDPSFWTLPPQTCLRMVAIQPIPKGHEIFNTYGQMANWQLIHMYGFAEPYPDNTNDTADIQMVTVREAALWLCETP